MASQRCDLQGKIITLGIQLCLKGYGSQQCVDKTDHYDLRFNENRLHLRKEKGVALQIEMDRPPTDILNDKEQEDYVEELNNLHPSDIYKKYVVSAERQERSIQLHTTVEKILFGRWRSSTRTDYELSFDPSCQTCRLSYFSAVTDKVGFSPNHQTAGESKCVIE